MDRKRNDATLSKLGDIYQYFIALLDCFKLKAGEKIQIELQGDITLISCDENKSFQKEVKHHIGNSKLSNRDKDLWNTLKNWILDYKDNSDFSQLILFTTADIPIKCVFKDWNTKNEDQKYDILFNIGAETKKNEEGFRTCYNDIFANKAISKEQILKILDKFTIEHLQPKIEGLSIRFAPYLVTIPSENRDNYVASLLGIVLEQVVEPPHIWEVTFEIFQHHAQVIAPAYVHPGRTPLPLDYLECEPSQDECAAVKDKIFVKALENIEYRKMIHIAISDYWKTTKTIVRYFNDNISYTVSLKPYKSSLSKRMFFAKETALNSQVYANREQEISASKKLCSDILGWEVKDFGSITSNQQFFQNGIIHDIVDDEKFVWDVREKNES